MFARIVSDNLFLIAETYRKAVGASRSQVSKDFFGRGDLLDGIKSRKVTITIKQVDKVIGRFREKWPKRTIWPMTRSVLMDQDPQK